MTAHDARLAPAAALSLISCALIGGGIDARLMAALLAALASAAVLAYVVPRRGPLVSRAVRDLAVAVAVAAGVAALVCGSAAIRAATALGSHTQAELARTHVVELDGVVIEEPRLAAPDRFTGTERWRAALRVLSIDGALARADVDIVLSSPSGVAVGDRVAARGAWSPSPNARRAATVWDAHVRTVAAGDWRSQAVDSSRERLRTAAEPLPDSIEGLTLGMVIGDDSRMPPEQVTDMRRSGLAHLTAVSGAHFAIVAVAVQWLLRRWTWPRPAQAGALAVAMLAFAALTGAEPSVIRALGMGLTLAVALAWGRPARALAALCASVVVLLAMDPMLGSALGFQLSVAAVAGIVLWSPHLALRFATLVTPAFARVLAIPAAAMGSTLPLIVGIAGGVGLYSVPANVVAGAAAGPVTLLGLAAVVLGWVWPGAANVLLQAAALAVRPVDWAARAFSDAPGAWLEWPPAPWGGPLAATIVACVIAATTSRRVRGWWRIAVLLAVVGLAASTPAFTALRAPHLPDWDVVACDVGQGDMLLLRSSHHGAVVIDTGPPGGEGAACLRRFGVRIIDLLILTHPHADHDGAVAELLAAVPVTQAWITPTAHGEAAHTALESAGVHVTAINSPHAAAVGEVDLRVMHPPSAWRSGEAGDAVNDSSLTVWADASGTTVLALGDLETQGQEALARSMVGVLVVDVVKIAHHGSSTQSEVLASLVTARVGVISVGEDNTYGHPAASTEAMYARRVQALLRTDTCGDVAIATDNGVRIATRCPVSVAG